MSSVAISGTSGGTISWYMLELILGRGPLLALCGLLISDWSSLHGVSLNTHSQSAAVPA